MRLADEIDVTASRNSKATYDLSKIVKEIDLIEFMKHEAVKDLEITDKEFIMVVETSDQNIFDKLNILAGKMKKTLDYCRDAVNNHTSFEITQADVVIKRI